MQAPETTEIVEATENRVRGACLIAGCTCKDSRIVSHRRAAFFAAMARRSGQTADRVVAVEPGWRIPSAPLTDLESPVPNEVPRTRISRRKSSTSLHRPNRQEDHGSRLQG